MGFKKSWDADSVASQIHAIAREASSPYNDGFTGWGCKQDLYRIQQILNEALSRCPNYGTIEEEWLKEQEQKRIIKILKEER